MQKKEKLKITCGYWNAVMERPCEIGEDTSWLVCLGDNIYHQACVQVKYFRYAWTDLFEQNLQEKWAERLEKCSQIVIGDVGGE